jgi:hypothetical protein
MKRTLILSAAASLFLFPCFAQKAPEPAQAAPGKADEAKPARTFVYDFNSPAASYENMVHDALQRCPVSMEATRLGGGDMVRVGDKTMSGPGQRIRLTLHDRTNPARILGARVAVRGTDGKPRMSTLASTLENSTNRAGEVTRTVTLNFNDRGESWAAADLVLRGLTSVSRVRLESLTYADGTTWQPEQGSVCAVVPSPLMLVAGR